MARQPGEGALRAVLSGAGAMRLTDRELLAQFSEGNQAAFAAIVKRHTGLVLGVCSRILPTVQDAEDACQATFLILAGKAKSGRWQSSIANWLYTTARRVAANASRAAARRLKRELLSAPAAAVSALDQMTGREAFAALDEELDKLPAIYREPLVLCYLQGLTRDQAAVRLQVPAATLKGQLDRGRKKLADALTKRSIDIGAGLIAVAATSPAGASSPRLVESILATIGGSPSASVALIAKGIAMNGISMKAKLLAFAAVVAAVTGFGLASMQIEAGPQEPALATSKQSKQSLSKEDAKRDDKSNAKQFVAKLDEPAKFKPIDPETIAAYKGLRAVFGGMDVTEFGPLWFSPGIQAAAKGLPGFNFCSLPAGMLRKLPPVQVPFGLDLHEVEVTDADLKDLKGIKNLTGLIVGGELVTDAGLKELKDMKNLTMLRISGSQQVTDAGLKQLKELKNLTVLTFGIRVTDASLKQVKDFKKLTALAIGGKGVTDAGLKELKELTDLTVLSLVGAPITDAGLKGLKELKNLATLDLFGTKVTDAGLKELNDLKNLSTLRFGQAPVTDAGLKELKGLTNLKSLHLVGTAVTLTDAGLKDLKSLTTLDLAAATLVGDSGLKELKNLTSLTTLNLGGTQVGDAGLKELKNLSNLSRLRLSGRRGEVTDAGLNELKDLKNLAELDLRGAKVTDEGLKSLKDLENLTTLALGNTKVTGAGLKELKELKNLTSLDISGPQMTDYGLKYLKELKNLTHLDLRNATITDAGLKQLKDLKSLTSLNLSSTMVTSAGLKELTDLKNLTSLNLGSTQITDAGLKELKDLENLTSLDLYDTQVTDAGLKELKDLKKLTALDPYGSKMTEVGLKEFESAVPRCRIQGPYHQRSRSPRSLKKSD